MNFFFNLNQKKIKTMKINIINLIAVLIMGIGSLAFTNPTTVILSNPCEGGYELQCDDVDDSIFTVCCSVCQSSGDIGECKAFFKA